SGLPRPRSPARRACRPGCGLVVVSSRPGSRHHRRRGAAEDPGDQVTLEAIISSVAENPAEVLVRLGGSLVDSGAIDRRSLDRPRRVAAETAGRLDHVLTQLGLVSERGLAEALAQLIRAPLVGPADYPDAPLFVDRLKVKFLRRVRAMSIAAAKD